MTWWHTHPDIIIRSYCAIAEGIGLELQPDGSALNVDGSLYGHIDWDDLDGKIVPVTSEARPLSVDTDRERA